MMFNVVYEVMHVDGFGFVKPIVSIAIRTYNITEILIIYIYIFVVA